VLTQTISVSHLEQRLIIHGHAPAIFGMPLGEMWRLEGLGEHCAKAGRYTFFLSGLFAFFLI
jgi:hypothetical protein